MRYKLGMFDSGIGGFSLLQEIHAAMPSIQVYYYSDSLYNPYGSKEKDFILQRSYKITEHLMKQGVKTILIACNTATAIAIDKLRQDFKDITFFGVEPYVNLINQDQQFEQKRGCVLVTVAMGKSERYLYLKDRLDPNMRLTTIMLEGLAKVVEENFFKPDTRDETIVKELQKYKAELSTFDFAVLGCTHYPLIKKLIEESFGLKCYSPCRFVAEHIKRSISLGMDGDTINNFIFYESAREGAEVVYQYSVIFS